MNRNSPATAFDIRKTNWNNNDIFPDCIYIDTNAVLEMVIPGRTYGSETKDYVSELINRNGIVTWSPFVVAELYDFYQYYFNNTNGKTAGQSPKDFENAADKLNSTRVGLLVSQKVADTQRFLNTIGVPLEVSNMDEIMFKSNDILTQYGNNIKDANHIAVCFENGINDILTHDAKHGNGMLRYDGMNVYGASNGIVSNYSSTNKRNVINF